VGVLLVDGPRDCVEIGDLRGAELELTAKFTTILADEPIGGTLQMRLVHSAENDTLTSRCALDLHLRIGRGQLLQRSLKPR
jgi:hypothetical protein